MVKRFVAKLKNMSHVPSGSIYRGNGNVDFEAIEIPATVEELLVEFDDKGKETFRKPGFSDVIPKRPNKPGGP